MIWLREGNNLVGYAPMLNKEYSEEEIRRMSNYSCYEGWSELSKFVMRMQGIGYEYSNGQDYEEYEDGIYKPIDAWTNFDFECFCISPDNDRRMQVYLKQIYEVFKNLKLYRIETRNIKHIYESAEAAKESMKDFISEKTLSSIDEDIKNILENPNNCTANLNKVLTLFSNYNYPFPYKMYDIPSNEVLKQLNAERKTGKILYM